MRTSCTGAICLQLLRTVVAPQSSGADQTAPALLSQTTWQLSTGWTWIEWAREGVPPVQSQLLDAGIPIVIDVVPLSRDVEGGHRFFLTIYRRDPVSNSAPRSRLSQLRSTVRSILPFRAQQQNQQTLLPDLLFEGPFLMRPANLREDAIQLTYFPIQAGWLTQTLARPALDFRVVRVGPVHRLPRFTRGVFWLLHAREVMSWNIRNHQHYTVHATRDRTDISGETIIIRLYSTQPNRVLQTDSGDRRVPQEGPWRIRCASDADMINLVPAPMQVDWVIRLLDLRDSGEDEPLKDFHIVERPRQPVAELPTPTPAAVQRTQDRYFQVLGPQGADTEFTTVAVRAYERQCVRIDTRHFFQNTQVVEEHYITAVGVVRTYHGGYEALAEDTDGAYPENTPAMAESIEIRTPSRTRPIAQTILTDHLPFEFEREPRSNMDSLIFCALAGAFSLKLGYDTHSYS